MNLKPPVNDNYAATVVQIRNIIPLENCDNVVGTTLLGYQAIVSKDTKVGDIGVVFTAETQLSLEYASNNNLHRHGDRNVDPGKVGYLEDTRRVKAIKFRGHRSDALFMPLSSFDFISPAYKTDLRVGDTFDTLNDIPVCNKYVIKKGAGAESQGRRRREDRIDEALFPKHFDTANYFKSQHLLQDEMVWVTQKLHGTSIRVGHQLVQRKLSWKEKLAKKFGVKVQETEWDYIFGSRNVVKDANSPEDSHFYDSDLYTLEGKKLEGLLPKGFVVYGELVGWTPEGAPIQSGYTYGLPLGTRELYIYRVTFVNSDGQQVDLDWDSLKEWCLSVGLKHVPEIGWEFADDLERYVNRLLDLNLAEEFKNSDETFAHNLLPVGKGMVDEGVVIRRDGLRPLVLKAKSPKFLAHETKMLDKEVADIEAEA